MSNIKGKRRAADPVAEISYYLAQWRRYSKRPDHDQEASSNTVRNNMVSHHAALSVQSNDGPKSSMASVDQTV